jgi:hypothetical protein
MLLTLSIRRVQVIIRHPKRRQKVHNNGVFPNFKNTVNLIQMTINFLLVYVSILLFYLLIYFKVYM